MFGISKMFNANAARELTESNEYKIKDQEQRYLDHALSVIRQAANEGLSSLYISKNEDDYTVFSHPFVKINLLESDYNVKCRQGVITIRW